MFHLHNSLAPRFPFLEKISTWSATFPSQAQQQSAVKFHKPVLPAGLCVLPVLVGCAAQLEVATVAASHRIASLPNSASKCLIKNETLSRTGPSSAAFALVLPEESWVSG